LCDLECPDGRYSDAGYPLGNLADPIYGVDNLDFWAHNKDYASEHQGNLGDATDVYDGIIFTRFGTDTNPNSSSKVTNKPTGIEIFNIHPEGKEMVFDVNAPPFADWISDKFPLIGTAFHRFIFDRDPVNIANKGIIFYLLNYGYGRNADKLVTVYRDLLTVDDIFSLNHYEVQKVIEQRIFMNNIQINSAKIIRENISFDTFQAEFMNLGIATQELGIVTTPDWIQKISLTGEEQSIPDAIVLDQNYPNPFNARTNITYNLPATGPVTLEVFNILGQKVITINRGVEQAGKHTMILDAEGLSSGLYFYRIHSNMLSQTKKFLLIR